MDHFEPLELSSITTGRSARYGANAVVYSAAYIGLLVAINYISTLHHTRLDLTTEKVFSLSSQSVNVVKGLQKPLKFYGFFQGGENPAARELYETFAYYSPKLTYELVDPDKHPELAERFKVSVMGTTHMQYGGDNGEGTNVTGLNEEALTNAIIRATRSGGNDRVPRRARRGGYDDAETQSGYGTIKKDLEGEGYEVRKLDWRNCPRCPTTPTWSWSRDQSSRSASTRSIR